MKQPDTAALRERLANYTPEEETDRRIAELRDLLKEISAVKDSMADIITGFTHAVADLQKKDIGARVHPDTLKALNEICTNFVVEVGKQLMAHRDRQLELQKEHEERIARMLERNKGFFFLSEKSQKTGTFPFLHDAKVSRLFRTALPLP